MSRCAIGLPGIDQQLAHHLRPALRRGPRLGQQFLPQGRVVHLFDQVQIAKDHRQHVVEIMRNTPGQLPDRLQLLGLTGPRQYLVGAQPVPPHDKGAMRQKGNQYAHGKDQPHPGQRIVITHQDRRCRRQKADRHDANLGQGPFQMLLGPPHDEDDDAGHNAEPRRRQGIIRRGDHDDGHPQIAGNNHRNDRLCNQHIGGLCGLALGPQKQEICQVQHQIDRSPRPGK